MYFNNKQEPDRQSNKYSIPFLISASLYFCIISIFWLVIEGNKRTGMDSLVVLWVVVPAYISYILAPVNLFTGAYFLFKYRDDPPARKWIVGVSLILSLFVIFILGKSR